MPACFYLICAGGLSLGHVNLRGLTGGRAEMAARLAAAAASSSGGSSSAEWVRSDWIIGTGWSESDWGGGWPDRTWLDEVKGCMLLRVGLGAGAGGGLLSPVGRYLPDKTWKA